MLHRQADGRQEWMMGRCGSKSIHRGQQGYTLFELILVVVMVLIFAAVALPKLSGFWPRFQLDRSARDIMGLARQARNDAAARGLNVQLNVDMDARSAWLSIENHPLSEPGFFSEYSESTAVTVDLPEGIAFYGVDPEDVLKEGLARIRFRPDGTSEDSMIALVNRYEEIREVGIRGITGRATIVPNEAYEK